VEKPKLKFSDKAFQRVCALRKVIPVEVNGTEVSEVVEVIEDSSSDEVAYAPKNAEELQRVTSGDTEGVETRDLTVEKTGYSRIRQWWQNPVKQELLVSLSNTPEEGMVTVEYMGSKAEVPDELAV